MLDWNGSLEINMTEYEFRKVINALLARDRTIKQYPASPETYGNVVQRIIDIQFETKVVEMTEAGIFLIPLWVGKNHGLMYKNVELIKAKV